MHITFVKKVLFDGSSCSQCDAVFKKIIADGLVDKINHVVIADVRDDQSPGMVLARQYKVKKVPFFVVDNLGLDCNYSKASVFDRYSAFKRFVNQ